MLGINGDAMSWSALTKKLAEDKVTWPQIVDGPSQEIARRWNVLYYPRMFVLDRAGVIRARAALLKPTEIERIVEEILSEK